MRAFINKNILTFRDLYEKFNQTEDYNHRPGFKQAYEESPFYEDFTNFTEADLKEAYNRLLAEYFNQPFGMLDEQQIHLNVFRMIVDYLPNVLKRKTVYNDIYNTELNLLQTRQSRTNTNTSTGNATFNDSGFENVVVAPNATASPTEPILDAVTQQNNKNLNTTNSNDSNQTGSEKISGSLMNAYEAKLNAIIDTLWDEFIEKFRKLFTFLYTGMYDYSYRNEINDEEV